jgi:beta-N-acetylhexosaminidase
VCIDVLSEGVRHLIGDVIVAGFDGPTVSEHALTLIGKHKVRNIILFNRNVHSMEQLEALNRSLQQMAADEGVGPLIICTDQENGIVRRVAPDLPGLPGNMALGATANPQLAREIGRATGQQLQAAGVNMNLAPVLDVNNNPLNPVIGVRSYGDDPHTVAKFAIEMIHGMQEYGVITCGKHFPGHGDSSVDSHLALPVIGHCRERLDEVELVPFRAAIAAGIDTIMTSHVVFPAVEPDRIPATISKRVLTGLLREELGFEGVITTDCMEMNAISETIGVGEGAVQALIAGADMVMISHRLDRQEEAIHAIAKALETGRLSLERLQEAAARVRALRDKRIGKAPADLPTVAELRSQTLELQYKVCAKAVTLVRAPQPFTAPNKSALRTVAVLLDSTAPSMMAAGEQTGSSLPEAVTSYLANAGVQVHRCSGTDGESVPDLDGVDFIIAGVYGTNNPAYLKMLGDLASADKPLAVLALQSPYVINHLPDAGLVIALYENTPWMIEAALRALFHGEFTGVLPVALNE